MSDPTGVLRVCNNISLHEVCCPNFSFIYWQVLCLHGYRQSAESFKNKLGALRKMLKKHIEFVFVTAPHEVPMPPGQEPQFGWWFCSEDRTFSARTPCKTSVGLEDSWELLGRVFADQGPFHGVLGFSQGAAMAAMLVSRARTDPRKNASCSLKGVP
jgi:predicted esterase